MDNTILKLENLSKSFFTLDGEIEVLKLAYTDGLLAPLFLGGDREVRQYMEATVGHLSK